MAGQSKQIDATLIIKHATAAVWADKNPVLAKGELGYEIDTRKSKIGDGIAAWNSLKYASGTCVTVKSAAPTTADIGYDIGTLWLNTGNNSVYFLAAKSSTAVWVRIANAFELALVNEAVVAQKLKTPRNIALSGAATGTASFDGSADASIVVTLANSGAAAGTYTKLTINAKGIVTAAQQLTAADIPTLTLSKISDAKSAASRDVGTAAGNVPLIGADGKLSDSIIPSVAITEPFVVSSQSAMLALNAQVGDIAIRSDESKSYILKAAPASTIANWLLLQSPTCEVLSINGKTGAVTLTTSDIAEGTNKYYTEARAAASFNTNFAKKSVEGLSDGAAVLKTTDTITINGGEA